MMNARLLFVLMLATLTGSFFAMADADHGDQKHSKSQSHNSKHGHEAEHEGDDDDDDDKDEGHSTVPASAMKQLPPASTRKPVTFEADIAPIFENYCTRCHGEDKQKGDIRLDTLEGALRGGEDGAILVKGNSARSPIVLAVSRVNRETAMPPDRKPGHDVGPDGKKLPPVKHVTAEEIGLIRAWIDQGAN